MQDYEHEEQNEVLKDESHDFVTQGSDGEKGSRFLRRPENPRSEQFLLLVCFVHLFHGVVADNPTDKRFGALSSNALVGANLLLGILTTSPEQNVYETLREEAARAFPSEAEWSDPAALRKLGPHR